MDVAQDFYPMTTGHHLHKRLSHPLTIHNCVLNPMIASCSAVPSMTLQRRLSTKTVFFQTIERKGEKKRQYLRPWIFPSIPTNVFSRPLTQNVDRPFSNWIFPVPYTLSFRKCTKQDSAVQHNSCVIFPFLERGRKHLRIYWHQQPRLPCFSLVFLCNLIWMVLRSKFSTPWYSHSS